jgi:NAD(P)-dependent dehydrogenase (short-subunit alcohol dehydrogenase family)
VILNASAVNGKGLPNTSVYAATKAAVRSFARSLAAELSPRGVRVNAISPGYVPTQIQGKMGLSQTEIDRFETGITETLPLRRKGDSEEIASAVVFLASSDSSYVTGADLTVDGGFMNV